MGIALGIGAAVAGLASAGAAAYGASQTPDAPDLEQVAADARREELNLMPWRRKIEAAARSGSKIEVPYIDEDGVWRKRTIDFTGFGDADFQADFLEKMADAALGVSTRYDSQFIAQRLKDLEQSDPEGFAAHKQLYGLIQQEINSKPDTEVAEELRGQVLGDLQKGGELDEETRREIEQSVARNSAALGNTIGNAPVFSKAMEVGMAAENRRNQRQQKAMQFITSGASPDDLTFKRFHQGMADLGAFSTGQKPQNEFATLQGAQNGPTPMTMAPNLVTSTVNPNAGQFDQSLAMQQYGIQANLPNPWLQGVGAVAQVAGTGVSAYGAWNAGRRT